MVAGRHVIHLYLYTNRQNKHPLLHAYITTFHILRWRWRSTQKDATVAFPPLNRQHRLMSVHVQKQHTWLPSLWFQQLDQTQT